MRLGDERSVESLYAAGFSNDDIQDGRIRYLHPRCGWVVLERKDVSPESDGSTWLWLVSEIERPDQ